MPRVQRMTCVKLGLAYARGRGVSPDESRAMQLPLCAQFYWIGEESLGTSNIVAANRREREESASPLPSFLVAFYNDGMGNQVCFDSRRC